MENKKNWAPTSIESKSQVYNSLTTGLSNTFEKHMKQYYDGLPNDAMGQLLTEEMRELQEILMRNDPYIKVMNNIK